MGLKNFEVSEIDVKVWMQMSDSNSDGVVSLEEYENVILKSLQANGFKIEGHLQEIEILKE